MVKDLLTFCTYRDTPGQRFRLHRWMPYLREHGIRTTESVFATPELERLAQQPGLQAQKAVAMLQSLALRVARAPRLRDYDAAFIYREIVPVGPPVLERLLTRLGGLPTAIDVDDPIFTKSMAYNARSPLSHYFKDPSRVYRIAERVDLVITINDIIAEHLRPYAKRVQVIPNVIPLERYPLRVGERAPGPIRLGYSGSPSTTSQLVAARAGIEAASKEVDLELRVMGGKAPYRLSRGETTELGWSAETEAANLASFDIGLAPAPQDEQHSYKSPVKVHLYMAMGLPVVATPFGMAARIVRHGENGFLARTDAEWRDAIVTLARDPELRARFGAAGRAFVEREVSTEAILPRVLRTFEDLMARR